MTLDEFIVSNWPTNAWVKHQDFSDLYVRKGRRGVILGDKCYLCSNVMDIANITAKKPGKGAFGRLVKYLVGLGFVVYVECVHNERFVQKLLRMEFVQVYSQGAPSFIFNHEGHLEELE